MAGSPSEDSGVGGSSNGISSGQRCQSGEALAEWRSSEQVENGTPSTSPPYWDTDDDDDDRGPKPSELYGKFTWKIESFSTINKRELRSNAFEVGGYKWYILIYPQGCDVCNHLSLFLCVANHDKLLPGWSHFAQFTIAVVNKDPKKSKYSDTLHRFWKKEHDWGWKKFMELSKVLDGFVVNDTLVIKAQVQVIREKSHRPFRCLDCQYRRELVRVYLTNVEQICRRFVEERRGKLGKLIEDKARWTSFCNFWKKVEKGAKRSMSREKTDVILKVVVKHFFIEKEVTSTLVMDSLYSGLKALESQSKSKEGAKSIDTEETPDPIVCVEQDMFVLAGDVLSLITRAALEPLPPKDEKGPQNRTKDGNSGDDLNKDSIERDERRLTELGRRSVEIFVLAHIFSNKIEVAHQEAVALEKQEELIREEEAAWQAESEQKTRRGASEKEKRAKKKQSKQRRSRKAKDKGRDEKFDAEVQDKKQHEGSIDLGTLSDLSVKQVLTTLEKSEALDDVSDVSFNGDDNSEAVQPCVEDRDASSLNSDTDTSEVHQIDILPVQNGQSSKKTNSMMDDSSSTCSTDSVPSVAAINGSYKMNLMTSYKGQISPTRGKKQRGTGRRDQTGGAPDIDNRLSEPVLDIARLRDTSGSCRATVSELEVDLISMDYQIQPIEHHMDQTKEEETVVGPEKKMTINDEVQDEVSSRKTAEEASPAVQPSKSLVHTAPSPAEPSRPDTDKKVALNIASPQPPIIPKLDSQKPVTISKPIVSNHQVVMSRPSSTPLTSSSPAPRPNTPPPSVVVSMAQTTPTPTPMLSRSVSATGRLGIDSSSSQSYAPSYRNAIMGKTMGTSFTPFSSTSNTPSPLYPQPLSTPLSMLSPQRTEEEVRPGGGFTFGSVTPEILQNRPPQWLEYSSNTMYQHPPSYASSSSASSSSTSGMVPDEFPHLDIINYLLDEEHSSKASTPWSNPRYTSTNHHYPLHRQFSFPGEMASEVSSSASNYRSRFDYPLQLDSYHHENGGMHHLYGGGGGGSYGGGLRGDMVPSPMSSVYGNGHNHWQYNSGGGGGVSGGAPDISLLSLRSNEIDGGGGGGGGGGYSSYHQQQLPEYSNLVSGYTSGYRPTNGR